MDALARHDPHARPGLEPAAKHQAGGAGKEVLGDLEQNLRSKFNELADWPTKPTSKSLFKSDPATTIKGAAAAPE